MGYLGVILGGILISLFIIGKVFELLKHITNGIKDTIEGPERERKLAEKKKAERDKLETMLVSRDENLRQRMNFYRSDYNVERVEELVQRTPEAWKALEAFASEREAELKSVQSHQSGPK